MRRRAMAEINVTPFVDVMLVLLIVFMVTAPLLTVGVPVDLPKTRAPAWARTRSRCRSPSQGWHHLPAEATCPRTNWCRLTAISANGYDQRIFVRGDTQTGTTAR